MWYKLWYQPVLGKTILDSDTVMFGYIWITSDGYRIGLTKGIQVGLILSSEKLPPNKKYQLRHISSMDLSIFSRDLPYDPTIFIVSDIKYPLYTLLPSIYHPNSNTDRYYALISNSLVVVLSSIDEIYGMKDWLKYINIDILRIENHKGCNILPILLNV